MTTANECFLLLSISSIKAYNSTELRAVPAPSLSEEETEERRREEESQTMEFQTSQGIIKKTIEELRFEGVIEE